MIKIKPLFIYHRLPDGTLRLQNPTVGEEVWSVPGRANRPIPNERRAQRHKLGDGLGPEASCHFCPQNLYHTPAEKARLVRFGNGYRVLEKQTAEQAGEQSSLFRRVPNLFEIVPFEFWRKNYGLQLSPLQQRWKDAYLSTPMGRSHVLGVISEKLEHAGKSPEAIAAMPEAAKLTLADAFFGGSHDLIVSTRHLKAGAEYDDELCSSGELSPEEHFLFLSFTLAAAREIARENPHVRHVSIYQNWLSQAGASFDHLHKQVLGVDTWGAGISRRLDLLRRYPPLYNDVILATAKTKGLILAENDEAIALVEPGHVFPCLAVYSKSAHSDPSRMSDAELKGFSDLVHAMHAATGSRMPCNEEWYVRPKNVEQPMPFHILIKWRVNTPAGFEGSSQIHINPLFPEEQHSRVLAALKELQSKGRIASGMHLGQECACEAGCLKYDRALKTH
jgi:galactose-1-phosphate uridylyltransferase